MWRAAWFPLVLALAAPAAAQIPGHPLPPGPRPFHERLEAADVVAVAVVEEIDEGRIRLRRETALAGAPPEHFEAKRSPLAPPPLATGDRALLLLRGARPPYVFADRPHEVIRLSNELMTVRWREAVRAALANRADPAALVAVYLDWVERGPETLSEIGRSSLADLAAEHAELRAAIVRALGTEREAPVSVH